MVWEVPLGGGWFLQGPVGRVSGLVSQHHSQHTGFAPPGAADQTPVDFSQWVPLCCHFGLRIFFTISCSAQRPERPHPRSAPPATPSHADTRMGASLQGGPRC